MNKTTIIDEIEKIETAHINITCTTSIFDVLQNVGSENYKNPDILAGDFRNCIELANQNINKQLQIIEEAIWNIKKLSKEQK